MRHIVIVGHADYPNYTWDEWRQENTGPVEVFGVNNPCARDAKEGILFDRFFQIHERWSLSEAEEQWVRQCPVPMYTCYDWPEVQDRREYPLEQVLSMPGIPHGPLRRLTPSRQPMEVALGDFTPNGGWLSCSFCYALGLACLEYRFAGALSSRPQDALRITLYGVELQGGSTRERLVEHAGVLWWCGFAAGLGIQVDTPPPSQLLSYPNLYGRSYYAEGDFARRRVKRFLAEARKEQGDAFLREYDSGMKARVKGAKG